ncbi:MAG: hypothetical protein ACRD5B_14625 [Nitrososphaeraceae archaeon]
MNGDKSHILPSSSSSWINSLSKREKRERISRRDNEGCWRYKEYHSRRYG